MNYTDDIAYYTDVVAQMNNARNRVVKCARESWPNFQEDCELCEEDIEAESDWDAIAESMRPTKEEVPNR